MASPAPEQVLADLGVGPGSVFKHDSVTTVDAQRTALEAQGCQHSDRIAKNLLLKDNRNRFFLCTALADTAVPFEKALGVRLGLKKGELRMAPPEAMQDVLGMPPGAATPLAAAAPTVARVVLLCDSRLREAPFLVHPLTNTQSVLITAGQLDAYLQQRGARAHYADLSLTDFTVGPDSPPDLKHASATVPEEKAKGEAKGVAAGTDSKKEKKAARAAAQSKSSKAQGSRAPSQAADSVARCVACLLDAVRQSQHADSASGVKATAALSDLQLQQLRADMELQVNAIKNAAYAQGMAAAKRAIAAHVTDEWA